MMKIMISFLIIFLHAGSYFARAQETGKIEVIKDAKIDSLVRKHRMINEQKKTTPGFRIQIYSGNQRNKASEVRALFQQKFPDYNAYLIYQQPNFKVRAGDFTSRMEAFRLLKQIQAEYDASFIVKDEVKLPKID